METSTKKYCATLRIEENVKFVGFLHDNQFVTEEAYQAIAKRITTNHNELIQEERKKTGNHLTAETSPITPGTSGSADCEKEGIMDWIGLDWIGLDWIGLDWIGLDWIGLDWIGLDWIGLRLCTICGHVGCDDSSKGCMQQSISWIQAMLLLLHYLIELGNGAISISCTDSQ